MDLKEAKNLINCKGERIVIVENGNPTMVLMSFDSYKKFVNNSNGDVKTGIIDLSDNNKVKQEEEKKEEGSELTLDDLPF